MKNIIVNLLLLGALFAQQSQVDSLETVIKNDDRNITAMFDLARLYYEMVSLKENEKAMKRAEELLTGILGQKPEHAEAMVYYGSLLTLMGRDAFFPWDKLSYVEEGCDYMDKAVRLEPDNIRLRIRRAMNNINLPDSFDRQAYYLEDFEFIRKHPAFPNFAPDFQQQMLYYSALACEKNEQLQKSTELYQQVIAINKDTEFAQRAITAIQK